MNERQDKESYFKVYPSYSQFKTVSYALTFLPSLAFCRRNTITRHCIDICIVSLSITHAHITIKTNFPLASIFKSMISFFSVIIVKKSSKAHHQKTKMKYVICQH